MTSDHRKYRNGALARKNLDRAEIEIVCRSSVENGGTLGVISGITTPDRLISNRAIFLTQYDPELVALLRESDARSILIFAPNEYQNVISQAAIFTAAPRQSFARLMRALFPDVGEPQTVEVHPEAQVHPDAVLSLGVTVGPGSVIDAGTIIYPNVTIGGRVRIGKQCVVKSGSVIGQAGFSVYRDETGCPHTMLHVGGVVIEDHVELGALNTVASGTINPTVIESHVKTDDHVHIAHNCYVGTRTLITACAEVSGSVSIGADCWLGPNSAIRDGMTIGDGAYIGIGSNVVASVPARTTVYGNPARPQRSTPSTL